MTITQIIGLVVVLILAALGIFFTIRKSQKHTSLKLVSIIVLLAIALTWIFGYGYFSGADFMDYGMNRLGLSDIPNLFYYGLNFAGDKIIFLLVLGGFYAILSKTASYKKLVSTLAEKLKGKEIIFVLSTSLIFTAMGSLFTQNFVSLIFVPFIISVILSMKLDKITAFSATFGSILIGLLGTTYGGEGAYYFNYYTGLEATTGIIYRLIILVIAFILFNLFNVLHMKKTLKGKNVNELDADPFKVENVDKKAKTWPIIVILSLIFILIVLGYVNWKGIFGIECFEKFHTWLIGLKIGELEIFKSLFGTGLAKTPFGAWDLFTLSMLLVILSIIIALIGKVKFNDFISSYGEGSKKFGKGIILFIAIYMVMIVDYMSPFMPTIINTVFSGIEKFNPYLVSLFALIANTFHTDFGFTGYLVGSFFMNSYAASTEIIHLIFTTMYGFVQLCLPTSALLLIGLSYLDIDYKTWIKYIWMFVIGILVILLVLFTILTYI